MAFTAAHVAGVRRFKSGELAELADGAQISVVGSNKLLRLDLLADADLEEYDIEFGILTKSGEEVNIKYTSGNVEAFSLVAEAADSFSSEENMYIFAYEESPAPAADDDAADEEDEDEGMFDGQGGDGRDKKNREENPDAAAAVAALTALGGSRGGGGTDKSEPWWNLHRNAVYAGKRFKHNEVTLYAKEESTVQKWSKHELQYFDGCVRARASCAPSSAACVLRRFVAKLACAAVVRHIVSHKTRARPNAGAARRAQVQVWRECARGQPARDVFTYWAEGEATLAVAYCDV